MLSVTLFLSRQNFPFPLTYRLFADDLSISLITPNETRAHRLLTLSLQNLELWADKHGFRFSTKKTHLIIFQKYKKSPFPPSPLETSRSHNFPTTSDKISWYLFHPQSELEYPHKSHQGPMLSTTQRFKIHSKPAYWM